ncbi:MAG TPA: uroporphyrinogen decarboxylase family protein [Planctomycetota bacterium]|nr:uroporphyrinogen decarboxylase family protein [Planctomycetota bacterium]
MTMTSRERMKRTFEHREADRVPIMDHPWAGTIQRWHAEGMPEDVAFYDYFDIDHVPYVNPDTSPRYPEKVVEETEDFRVTTSAWGVTIRRQKHADSTPEFLDFTVTGPDAWRDAKKRMTPSRDRVDWDALKRDYAEWRRQDLWIDLVMWYGFDVTHSWMIGTERTLMALALDPEWIVDVFNHELDMSIALGEMMLDAGFTFDGTYCYDDLGFKLNQFMSLDMFRELVKPVHARAIAWAHSRGMKTELHSCGDIRPFVPEFVGVGLDALNPLEVKAGMDTLELKRKYGNDLVLHGGINAVKWTDLEAFEAEMREKLPVLKKNGGYIFGTDHSVPNTVSLEAFRDVVKLARELGRY